MAHLWPAPVMRSVSLHSASRISAWPFTSHTDTERWTAIHRTKDMKSGTVQVDGVEYSPNWHLTTSQTGLGLLELTG